MRTKMLLSSLIVGACLVCAPAAFAQSANIDSWPVETDGDSMLSFSWNDCARNPQEINCVGFDNGMQAPATVTPAPYTRLHHG